MTRHQMKFFVVVLGFMTVLSASCKKAATEEHTPGSTIKVDTDGVAWTETRAVGTLNMNDGMVSIMGQEGLETFSIRFKKPSYTGRLEDFHAGSLFAPMLGAASIADAYVIDETEDNRLRVYVIDNLKKRIAGEFSLHLKREEQYGPAVSKTYTGKFDVLLEEMSF